MLKRNLTANYLGQAWTGLMGLAFLPIYIKYLGMESYGLIGLFGVLQAWLTLLDAGMSPTLAREMARSRGDAHTAKSIRDLLRTVEMILAGVALLVAVGIWVSSEWLATHWLRAERLSTDIVGGAFAIMGVVTALRMLEGMYRSCLVGLQRQVFFNCINAALMTMRSAGAVAVLAFVSPTVSTFFVWQGLMSLVTLFALGCATYGILPPHTSSGRFSARALLQVWRFAGGIFATTALSLLLTQVDKVLLSRLLTLSEYGNYALAVAVAGALYMLITPITQAWYPKLCELDSGGERARLADVYHQGAQLVSILAGSATIVLALFSHSFLQLWTQNTEIATAVAPILALIAIGNLLNGLMWMPYQMQLATGWTSFAVAMNCVAVVLVVPGILWATPRYGGVGAAAVWATLNAGYVLVGAHFMYRRILPEERRRWFLADLAQPLAFGIAASALVKFVAPASQDPLAQFGTLATAAVTTLAAATLGASHGRKALSQSLRPLFAKVRPST